MSGHGRRAKRSGLRTRSRVDESVDTRLDRLAADLHRRQTADDPPTDQLSEDDLRELRRKAPHADL